MKMHVSSVGNAYTEICQTVLRQGARVSPRGMATREILDAVIVADDPSDSLPTGCNRKLNSAIGVAEALQLIGGVSVPELMTTISPTFARFMDDGKFRGAYGPRIAPQLEHVVDKIKEDRDTRQAVVTIWDPSIDNAPGFKDYPCTVTLVFAVRDDKLNLHVTMRSNDVWWGLAYDAFQFSQLQWTVAAALDVPAGRYHHHAISLHAYDHDTAGIEALTERSRDTHYSRFGVGWRDLSLRKSVLRAQAMLSDVRLMNMTATEQWMTDTLAPHLERLHAAR